MGDFCVLFPRNPHFWKSLPTLLFSATSSIGGMLHQLMPSTHIGVDMSPKWEKSARKWRKNFEYPSYCKVYLTEQRDKSLLSDITSSIHSSNSFLPRERVLPKPMLTRARTRAFPGILNKKPSQPSHSLFKISDFRLCNTPFIFLPILPPKRRQKGKFQHTLLKSVRKLLIYH